MKAEITLENKAKFFAQYWGQNVRFWTFNGPGRQTKVGHTYMSKQILKGCSLYLKPLSTITDDDLIEIGTIVFIGGNKKLKDSTLRGLGLSIIDVYEQRGLGYLSVKCYQYLQSKGYALPWLNLSVEELVNCGWIKLID